MMASVPVVEVIPGGQCEPTIFGVLIGSSIGPFTQGRLDKSLGLAVGLWSEGSSEFLGDAILETDLGKRDRTEGRTVVSDDALNADPKTAQTVKRCPQEARSALTTLIRIDIGKGNSAVIVHGDEDKIPTDTDDLAASTASDSMADFFKAAKLLDVDMQQVTRCLVFVAL